MVVLLNTICAREALFAYVNSNERLATEVSAIRRIDRMELGLDADPRKGWIVDALQ